MQIRRFNKSADVSPKKNPTAPFATRSYPAYKSLSCLSRMQISDPFELFGAPLFVISCRHRTITYKGPRRPQRSPPKEQKSPLEMPPPFPPTEIRTLSFHLEQKQRRYGHFRGLCVSLFAGGTMCSHRKNRDESSRLSYRHNEGHLQLLSLCISMFVNNIKRFVIYIACYFDFSSVQTLL